MYEYNVAVNAKGYQEINTSLSTSYYIAIL